MATTSENTKQGKAFSLKKSERLHSKKIIDKLFAEGDSLLQYPLKLVFLKTDLQCNHPVQAGFTASKKNFKKAVARNRIKRLLREAYRTNKHLIYDELKQEQLALFIIFIGKELPEHKVVKLALRKGISKMIAKITDYNSEKNE